MAFQQPAHRPQLLPRQLSFVTSEAPSSPLTTTSLQILRKRTLDQSEEWVLFSPQSHSASTTTHTAGLSHLSDFGSLDTAARSDQVDDEAIRNDRDDVATEHGSEDDGEGTELDSLDDGLHAFHEPSSEYSASHRLDQSGGTILPTHDGLGTFPASNSMLQEQLYAFERFNPRRVLRISRRRSSVHRRLDALEEVEEADSEEARWQRIETWRMEQSRALLEEIEKETRKMRRISRTQSIKSRADSAAVTSAASTPFVDESMISDSSMDEQQQVDEEDESFLERVTRKVIRNLMGIDDSILSVILGEDLPQEDDTPTASPSSSVPKSSPLGNGLSRVSETRHERWERKVLERIARELGTLVHQLSEHPGAFSTYLQTQSTPEYAGFTAESPTASHFQTHSTSDLPSATSPTTKSQQIDFEPTVPHFAQSDASVWGIEEGHPDSGPTPYDPGNIVQSGEELTKDKEYWERELDVKMVFNFLVKRFSKLPDISRTSSLPKSGSHPALSSVGPSTSQTANPPTTLASARRAAFIRQAHPLVNGPSRRRNLSHRHHAHHFHPPQPVLRRPLGSASSCASQSTKRSKGSSRNYWDIGGSVNSGPSAAWGEV